MFESMIANYFVQSLFWISLASLLLVLVMDKMGDPDQDDSGDQ